MQVYSIERTEKCVCEGLKLLPEGVTDVNITDTLLTTMTSNSTTDRSLRSVFGESSHVLTTCSYLSSLVGNIPYDATEEKLKDIFSEVGPVVSFKLVYDRETGKPKGYGFC